MIELTIATWLKGTVALCLSQSFRRVTVVWLALVRMYGALAFLDVIHGIDSCLMPACQIGPFRIGAVVCNLDTGLAWLACCYWPSFDTVLLMYLSNMSTS
jgi:hypothetical protein